MAHVTELVAQANSFYGTHAARRGSGSDSTGSPAPVYSYMRAVSEDEEAHELAAAREWQARVFDAGLAWPEGPVELGGRGLTPAHSQTLSEVAARFDLPSTSLLTVNLDIVRAAVDQGGNTEQRRRWLPALLRADTIWCQLFSEPEAGSDLASLRTTARQSEDGRWRVRGQKVWSSGAHYSDLGLLLARTGTLAERGRGLTLFALDMRQPGVTVRPLQQMSGSAHFNEVFLEDALIEDADRIGAVGEGWSITAGILNSERAAAGEQASSVVVQPVERLIDAAEAAGRADDPEVRRLVAEAWLREQVLAQVLRQEPVTGDPQDATASLVKLLVGQQMVNLIEAAGTVMGWRSVAESDRDQAYPWSQLLLGAPAHRIAGGTDEIQKNILAERVLGLPREPRAERSPTP